MGELKKPIRVEENQLIVAEEITNSIKNFEMQKKLIDYREQKLKDALIEVMREYNFKKWTSPDGTLSISYTPETEATRFDSKKFEEEHRDLYWEYLKTSKRKESIRITIKDDVEE